MLGDKKVRYFISIPTKGFKTVYLQVKMLINTGPTQTMNLLMIRLDNLFRAKSQASCPLVETNFRQIMTLMSRLRVGFDHTRHVLSHTIPFFQTPSIIVLTFVTAHVSEHFEVINPQANPLSSRKHAVAEVHRI